MKNSTRMKKRSPSKSTFRAVIHGYVNSDSEDEEDCIERNYDQEDDEMRRILTKLSPKAGIQGLVDKLCASRQSLDLDLQSLTHLQCSKLKLWSSEFEVFAFLRNEKSLNHLLHVLKQDLMNIVINIERMKQQHVSLKTTPILIMACFGCNTCYDAGACLHPNMPIKKRHSRSGQDSFSELVHRGTSLLELLICMLRWNGSTLIESQHILADMLCETPLGITPKEHSLQQAKKGELPLIYLLVDLVGSCARILPKCSHLAIALLSLFIGRRPLGTLSLIDPESLIKCLEDYIFEVKNRIMNDGECSVEQRFGVIQVINTLPLLHFVGEWRPASKILSKSKLPALITVLAMSIIRTATINIDDNGEGEIDDGPSDLHKFPELSTVFTAVDEIYGQENKKLVWLRPFSFSSVALLEILGSWNNRDIEIPNINKRLFPLHNFELLTGDLEQYAYIQPIVADLLNHDVPSLPTKKRGSLIRGPLSISSMKCSLPSCRRTQKANPSGNSGNSLAVCSGGCRGLARYCSSEHQRKHWDSHKIICKFSEDDNNNNYNNNNAKR